MNTIFWVVVLVVILVLLMWFARRFGQPEFAYPMTSEPLKHETVEDDLQVIEGIDPALEQALKEAGIRTYRDLAKKTPEELQAILDAAGIAHISHLQTWPEQARLAAEGRWDELRALQATLKGGIRKKR